MPRGDEMSEELRFIDGNDPQETGSFRSSSYDEDEDDDGYGLPSEDGDSLWDSAEDSDDDDDEEDEDAFEEEPSDDEEDEDDVFGGSMVRRGPGLPRPEV